MSDPQVIIRLDSAGNVQCEAPGLNGAARTKIEGVRFENLDPAIQAALIAQRDRAQAPTQLAPKAAERLIPEDRLELAKRAGEDRRKRHLAWIETLPREQADREREKLRKIAERQHEAEIARAHEIYQRTAQRHSVELANRVISDPKRRPRKAHQGATAKPSSKSTKVDLTNLREGIDYKIYSW